MNPTGGNELLIRARSALLDALEALDRHREAVIVVGAQAVYLHTGQADVALAEATKDSDLAIDPRALGADPLIEDAMRNADFDLDPSARNPGAWISPHGIPVDLMVPEALAVERGRRSAVVPPHDRMSFRWAAGLEAAIIDHATMTVHALDLSDGRALDARVAGPAAIMVAKVHKITERLSGSQEAQNKDAHDVYRLLVATSTEMLRDSLIQLLDDPLSHAATTRALGFVGELFARGPDAIGSDMAGRAELGIGDPDVVSAASAALSTDLLDALKGHYRSE
jgi:hypothetical protein